MTFKVNIKIVHSVSVEQKEIPEGVYNLVGFGKEGNEPNPYNLRL